MDSCTQARKTQVRMEHSMVQHRAYIAGHSMAWHGMHCVVMACLSNKSAHSCIHTEYTATSVMDSWAQARAYGSASGRPFFNVPHSVHLLHLITRGPNTRDMSRVAE
jgi:hypothetical protein